jgi:hypothetical protein
MKKAADTLFLLATFSLRTGQIGKALHYTSAGQHLFPDDIRLTEVHAYALLLQDRHDEAEALLSATPASTPNLEFLRGRTAILLGLPKDERRTRLRRYLALQ